MSIDIVTRKVAVIYFTGSGRTEELAKAVAEGAKGVEGVSADVFTIDSSDIQEGRYSNQQLIDGLTGYDAMIFGTPTYMAGPAAQFKAFADATVGVWTGQRWKDKFASGFTVSGTPSGDKLSTLQYLQAFGMQHGMIWVGLGEEPMQESGVNRLGSWCGVMAQTQGAGIAHLGEGDLETGRKLGARVAGWAKKTIFAEVA